METDLARAEPPAKSSSVTAGSGALGGAEGEKREIADVEAKAKRAGLGGFSANRSEHFVAVGDAPEEFRREALDICERLSVAFLKDLGNRGFALKLPERRMSVVILKDRDSYEDFSGEEAPANVGGHYELETNRLVVFDFRPSPSDLEAVATRVNLLSLVHEATHQLCFNTGLLSRQSDVPACISEGLASYAELWQRRDKLKFGGNHPYRLLALRQARQTELPWIPIAELFTKDELFSNEKSEQLAYSEGWLVVHYFLHAPSRLPKFREYLAKLKTTVDPEQRRRVAEAFLGPLDKLDKPIKAYAAKLASH